MLPYPPSALGLEVAFVFLWALFEFARLRLGEAAPAASWGAAVPAAAGDAHCLTPQPFPAAGPPGHGTDSTPARPPPATRGNKLELVGPSLFALGLAAPTVIFHAYYTRLQTYVLRLDVIINGIGLAFTGAEAVLGLAACVSFWRAQRF